MSSLAHKARILVVEDEKDVSDLMMLHLKREGFDATAAEHGEEALKLLADHRFDLLVLDWMLPGVSGLEICRQVRKKSAADGQVPVLMVTARADAADIVLGLEVGADDYVTKPFEIPVFIARVRALLRRAEKNREPAQPGGEETADEKLRVDVEAHRAFCGNQEIPLTPYEFGLLSALVAHRGKVLSRQKLIDMVQGEDVSVIARTIDTHVFGLRKKLGECSDMIETIRGVGYRIRD